MYLRWSEGSTPRAPTGDTLCFQGKTGSIFVVYLEEIINSRLVSALRASSGDTLRALSGDTLWTMMANSGASQLVTSKRRSNSWCHNWRRLSNCITNGDVRSMGERVNAGIFNVGV